LLCVFIPVRWALVPTPYDIAPLSRQIVKRMGSSANHHAELGVAAVSGPLSSVANQIQTELHELVTRADDLRQRIRSIRKVLRGLQDMANPSSFESGAARSTWPRANADSVVNGRIHRYSPSISRRTPRREAVSLERACRIALMEVAGSASIEEIYGRIVRRGSFSFTNLKHAKPPLAEVLHAMTCAGEVRCLRNGARWRWERVETALEDQPTPMSDQAPADTPSVEGSVTAQASQGN
jgi:hypothetical protein